jgi:hypothetical protein
VPNKDRPVGVAKYETAESIKNNYTTISKADAAATGKKVGIYSKTEKNVSILSTNGQSFVLPASWAAAIQKNGLYERNSSRTSTSGSLFKSDSLRISNVEWDRKPDGTHTIAVYTSFGGSGGNGYAKL